MSEFSRAKEQYDVISNIVNNVFNDMARNKGLLAMQVAIVAEVDATNQSAKVYFPTDMSTPTTFYANRTGKNLSVGQKVYIFHKYGDVEQGWIMET